MRKDDIVLTQHDARDEAIDETTNSESVPPRSDIQSSGRLEILMLVESQVS